MTFFYDLNKRLQQLAGQQQTQQITEGKQSVAEKIEPPIKTNPAERGKHSGKTVDQLKKQLSSVKDKMAGYKERGEKVPADLRGTFSELTFAIRAKQAHGGKWSSIKEQDQEDLMPYKSTMKEEDLDEEYQGFEKTVKAIKKGGSARDPEAVAAAIGRKKYGKEKFQKAAAAGRKLGREMEEQYILEKDVEEGNKFTGNLMKARAAGKKMADLDGDGDMEPVREAAKPDFLDLDKDGNRKESMKKAAADKKKHAIKEYDFDDKDDFDNRAKAGDRVKTSKGTLIKTSTGVRHEKRHEEEPEMDHDDDDTPKKKGRKAVGAGKGKKIGAKHSGTSKLARKGAIAEDDMISLVDKGEYDREGDMAKEQLHTIEAAAEELASILSDDENLPEWVQSKITKAMDYIDTARDYMKSSHADRDDEMMPERKLTKGEMGKREKFVKGMKKAKGDFEKRYGERGEEVMYATATKMAKGNKKEESVKETDAPKNSKGGIQFGKGVYESMNSRVENMIAEGMNVSVNISQDSEGNPTKNITVSAEGDDAEALAKLLNLAGIHSHEQELDENKPDWPTDEETIDDNDPHLERFAGGLNGPKSTGQTTGAPFNRQLARQGAGKMAEGADLGMNLYKELQSYKGKK